MITFLGRPIVDACPDCGGKVAPYERHELKAATVDAKDVWGRLCGKCMNSYRLPTSTSTGHYDSVLHG